MDLCSLISFQAFSGRLQVSWLCIMSLGEARPSKLWLFGLADEARHEQQGKLRTSYVYIGDSNWESDRPTSWKTLLHKGDVAYRKHLRQRFVNAKVKWKVMEVSPNQSRASYGPRQVNRKLKHKWKSNYGIHAIQLRSFYFERVVFIHWRVDARQQLELSAHAKKERLKVNVLTRS